jgi:peroxiredoxin
MRGLPALLLGLFLVRKTGLSRLRSGMFAIAFGSLAAVAASATGEYALLGRAAPDFALKAFQGENVRLSEHRGEVVVLSFWSSRCAPCGAQLDALDRSFATYQSAGLKVFGVGVDDDARNAAEFARTRAASFPMLLDPGKSVSRTYRVDNLPMTVLIDRGGNVRYVHRDYGAKSDARYLDELRELLNE